MRLTLRTLLAYRDGVLSPEDQSDLHQRIQENPHIGNLLRRINELSVQRAIPTPKLDADEVGDPNVVAEYLDDVLTNEMVIELERLCLERGEFLCELAQCHALLSEAMHTQVAVPKTLQSLALKLSSAEERERVRENLVTQARSRQKSAGETRASEVSGDGRAQAAMQSKPSESTSDVQVNVQAPMVASGGETIKHVGLNLEDNRLAKEVPDYLIASKHRGWQSPVAIIVLSALLGILFWYTVGSLSSLNEIWQNPQTDPLAGQVPEMSEKASTRTADPDARGTRANGAQSQSKAIDNGNQAPGADEGLKGLAAVEPAEGASEGRGNNQPQVDPESTPPGNELKESVPSDPQAATEVPTPDGSGDTSAAGTAGDSETEAAAQPESGIRWMPADEFERQALVLAQSQAGPLQVVSGNSVVAFGSTILAPSPVPTTLEIDPWRCTLTGPSIVGISNSGNRIEFSTKLMRAMLVGQRKDVPLQLDVPHGKFSISVFDSAVWLAIEISYRPIRRGAISQSGTTAPVLVIVAGADQELPEGPLALVQSIESGQQSVIERTGLGVALVGNQEFVPFTLTNPPRWYGKRTVRHIDQEASSDLASALQRGTNISLAKISAMASDRRPEVAALAIQTSMLLGDWQPFASELLVADRLRSHWFSTLGLARQMLAAGAVSPEALKDRLADFHGPEAPELVELLVGLKQDQQNSDGLASLIRGLESDSLPIRVASAYEMIQLTGQDNGYLPHAPVRASIQQFRRQLSNGKLAATPIGDPVWERKVAP
jgi:hypothetical protein